MQLYIIVTLALIGSFSTQLYVPEEFQAFAYVGLLVAVAIYYFKIRPRNSYQRQMSELNKMRGKASNSHGSATFASPKEIKNAGLSEEKGFILGKLAGKFIRFRLPGHLITFAPTRSGKGVGQVIPNLLDHPGSVVVNDIKGENCAVTSRHRSKFSKVITFAPFSETSGCYNPMDFIRVGTSEELDDAALIADMIIITSGGDDFFGNEAKNVVTGLILFVATESPPALKNIGEVRYLLMQEQKAFQATIKAMQNSKNEAVRRMGNSIGATEPKVIASILSTAKSQTAVWDSPRLTSITSRSDFNLEDIKKEPTSFYIVIPPEYLDVYKPVVRLMIGTTLASMTRTMKKPQDPVLFIIDEFPALGYMKNIEVGVGYLAGYGVSLWMFIQDLSQIKEDYPKWASLIANCACRVAFGTNDFDTAKTISEMLGNTTIRVEGEGKSKEAGLLGGKTSGTSTNVSETSRALMTPDEVMRMPFDSQLVFVQGVKPIYAEKVMYFKDKAFVGKFDQWGG